MSRDGANCGANARSAFGAKLVKSGASVAIGEHMANHIQTHSRKKNVGQVAPSVGSGAPYVRHGARTPG